MRGGRGGDVVPCARGQTATLETLVSVCVRGRGGGDVVPCARGQTATLGNFVWAGD